MKEDEHGEVVKLSTVLMILSFMYIFATISYEVLTSTPIVTTDTIAPNTEMTTVTSSTFIVNPKITSTYDLIDPLPYRHMNETITPTPKPPTPIVPKVEYVIDFTGTERALFERIVQAEAGTRWSLEGYHLIAQTIINQLNDEHHYWGHSLRSVLTYSNNFSVYTSGAYKHVKVSSKAKEAVDLVLRGVKPNVHNVKGIEDIQFFCTESHLKQHPNGFHAGLTKIVQFENVIFFGTK